MIRIDDGISLACVRLKHVLYQGFGMAASFLATETKTAYSALAVAPKIHQILLCVFLEYPVHVEGAPHGTRLRVSFCVHIEILFRDGGAVVAEFGEEVLQVGAFTACDQRLGQVG